MSLFGIVPAGLPVLTTPSETPSPTSFLYSITAPPPATTTADAKPFSHVVVFLLPGVQLPAGTAAAIYLVTPPPAGQAGAGPVSRFLGGIGPGKESAIFKIAGTAAGTPTILGISVEDAGSVASRIEAAKAARPGSSTTVATTSAAPPSTLQLAQRIGQNAFNFLASYSTRIPGSASTEEVVPMRAFEEWWRKFEARVRNDPTFLERATD